MVEGAVLVYFSNFTLMRAACGYPGERHGNNKKYTAISDTNSKAATPIQILRFDFTLASFLRGLKSVLLLIRNKYSVVPRLNLSPFVK